MAGNIQGDAACGRCRGIAGVGRRTSQNKCHKKNIHTLFFLVVGDIHTPKIWYINCTRDQTRKERERDLKHACIAIDGAVRGGVLYKAGHPVLLFFVCCVCFADKSWLKVVLTNLLIKKVWLIKWLFFVHQNQIPVSRSSHHLAIVSSTIWLVIALSVTNDRFLRTDN